MIGPPRLRLLNWPNTEVFAQKKGRGGQSPAEGVWPPAAPPLARSRACAAAPGDHLARSPPFPQSCARRRLDGIFREVPPPRGGSARRAFKRAERPLHRRLSSFPSSQRCRWWASTWAFRAVTWPWPAPAVSRPSLTSTATAARREWG